MRKKRFEITTLGCKVNQSESALISAQLNACGYNGVIHENGELRIATSENDADLCIINTCTVTEKASMQSRQAIRRAIRNHPNARIVVTGCYAQTQPEEVKKIKGIHDIFGHCEKHCLSERLLSDTAPTAETPSGWRPTPWYESTEGLTGIPAYTNRTRAFLKIQDGCNAHCTYCIVPRARGNSQSMPFDRVFKNLIQLENAGHREIVLSGIHLGAYGKDLEPKKNLLELLSGIEISEINARIRLSSIEPRELTDEIIALSSRSNKICHHFHIPLQSGDDGILKKMGRPYTGTFFRELVLSVHERMPDAAIGVDTLIGFPGETDEAFENTYDLLRALPISYLHVFPFSPRDKTPAAKFENRPSADTVKSRCQRMRALSASKKQQFYLQYVGKTVTVLVEGKRDPNTGNLKGTTSNYIPVFLAGHEELKNTMIQVLLEKPARDLGVIGTIVSTK